jgi:hypothetical protein
MERETGIEPVTSSLGSWRSTAELLPLRRGIRVSPRGTGLNKDPTQSRGPGCGRLPNGLSLRDRRANRNGMA